MNELQWVEFLRKKKTNNKKIVAGIGDDCAVIRQGKGYLLYSSDLFIENVHFDRKKMSFKDIGQRAAARAMSDIVACGGIPRYLGVSCGRPRSCPAERLKNVYRGIEEYCKGYDVTLIGGDTSLASELVFDIWVIGDTDKYVLRSTAREGDAIFVTGRLGRLAFDQVFDLRVREISRLTHEYKINSLIDISDGFIIDLFRVLEASGKGALLCADRLPLTRGMDDLFRGEDYELIFTVDKKEDMRRLKKKYFYVGDVTAAKKGYCLRLGNEVKKIDVKGYLHF